MPIDHPYLMFLGDAPDQLAAKTAAGVAYWRPDWCVGQLRLPGCNADLKLPDMTLEQAAAAGVRTLVLGVANRGGKISVEWESVLLQALDLGFDIASGLHQKVTDLPAVREKAAANGRQLFDVRHPDRGFEVADGKPRSGRRCLTVGTDCSAGKMFTALALEADLRRRGVPADFRATGQTGIFIAGSGVSVDAVVADFISGATEWLCPPGADDHWDLIEGQGSLYHASFAGVSMGLLHGAQAEALVMCHVPGRPHMRGLPGYALPDIGECIRLNEACARLTCPTSRVVGIACNTSAFDEAEKERILGELSDAHGLPCVDPVRDGVESIVDRMLAD